MKLIKINPRTIPFDIKSREMCKSCKRYNTKATCPPYVESVEYYKKLFRKYENGMLVYKKFKVTDDWKELGRISSLEMNETLLIVRDELFNEGHYYVNIFGSGSCKRCDKCSFPCRFPDKSVIPLEGAGVDIVKLMEKHNIIIKFPVKDFIYRIGLVLYD